MEVKPGYKQTEVGVIPEEWEVKKLGDVSAIKTGKKNNEDKVENGAYPFFVRSQTVERINTYSYNGEAVLVPGEGGIGSIFHYINGKFDYHQRVYKISDFISDVCGKFIYYCMLQNFNKQAMRNSVKATVDSLRLPTFQGFEFLAPPFDEQQAIAAALSDVDALISALDKLIAKKRDIKQAAMQQLLTGKKRLPGFSGEWEVRKLGEIGLFKKGRNIPKNQLSTQGEPCVLYGEIYTRYDCVVKELVSFIPKDVAEQSTVIKPGDILFAGSGETAEEIGKCFAYIGAENACAGGDLIILSPKEDDSTFLGYQLNSPMICKQKANLGQGSSVVHIYVSGLATVKVPLPPLSEQQAIATILSDMDAEIAALEQKRDKTRALKQGMMQELLTGRTRLV